MATMAKSRILCFSMLLIYAPNRVDGSSLHRIQYLASRQKVNNAGALASCAKRAADDLFEPTNRIVVIVDDNESSGNKDESITTNDFLKIISSDLSTVGLASSRLGNAKIFLDPYSHWHGSDRYPSYVIISNNLENLMEIFSMGRKSSTWLEYLIVTRIDEDSINILGVSLLERGYIRVAFVHAENNDESPIWLRRYNVSIDVPSGSTKLKKIATCNVPSNNWRANDFKATRIPLANTLCPSKACLVTAAHVSDEMVGASLITAARRDFDCAVRVINFFIECKNMRLRHRINYDKNLNWSKTVELIERDKIDVAYGSFIPRIVKSVKYMDAAAWFDFETITFIDVTKFITEAPLTKLFLPLDVFVWLCILTLLVIYTIFALLVQKAHRRKLINESISTFHVWTILLGQGMNLPFNIGLRTLLGMWMIAALLINAAYGSAFRSSLASFKKVNALKTLHDLSKSGRPIVGTAGTRKLFNNSDDEDDRRIFERWRTVAPEEIFSVVSKERVVGVDYSFNIKLYNIIETRRFRPRLYSLKEPILVYPLYFYLKKYHPYTKPLREIVFRTSSGGLIYKTSIDNVYNANAQSRIRYFSRRWARQKRTVTEMAVAFKTFAVGVSISFITFLYELYRNKRCRSLIKTKMIEWPKASIKIKKVEIDFHHRGRRSMGLTVRNFSPTWQPTLY